MSTGKAEKEEKQKSRRRWFDPLWDALAALRAGSEAMGSRPKTSMEEEEERRRRAERNKSDLEREQDQAK